MGLPLALKARLQLGTCSARLNRLLKKSDFGSVRVELAFRPASKPFVCDHEPASAGGTNGLARVFQQPVKSCPVTRRPPTDFFSSL